MLSGFILVVFPLLSGFILVVFPLLSGFILGVFPLLSGSIKGVIPIVELKAVVPLSKTAPTFSGLLVTLGTSNPR